MIIGTAGHIDHGKSTLVTALTGRAMDRLAEERRRGITIDLNFAPLEIDGVVAAGIVDVPGHEDFVRTMVAGASGIDLVLLVVDAVEGIRPQTLEHLAVVEQLRIPRGIPVLTKTDIADPDWIDLVEMELAERLAASPVAFERVARVSALTGAGIDELKERLRPFEGQVVRPTDGPLRLPIDRAFALAGVGTVVTGTLWSGTVAVGDAVRIEPGALDGRVRSVESHGRSVGPAVPGSRTAIGLAGVELGSIGRGQTLVRATDQWSPVRVIDCVVSQLSDAPRPLVSRNRVRVHHGTAEVMARVYPREPISPGGSGPARLVLESPLIVRGGDRLVLRSYSPVTTIGGGWIADPDPPRKAAWPAEILSTDPRVRLAGLLRRREQGIPASALPRVLGEDLRVQAVPDAVQVGDRLLHRPEFEELRAGLLGRLEAFHRQEPAAQGISLETLRASLRARAWLADEWLGRLEEDGLVRLADGLAALASHRPSSGGGDEELASVVRQVEAAGLEGTTVSQLAGAVRVRDLRGALRVALDRGLVEAVEMDRYLGTPALAQAAEAIRDAGKDNVEIQPGAVRDRIGLSRKHVIPLLEWADRKGITWRDREGKRRLRPSGDRAV
ncbi:MAG TPA: selenocysteine-specific translation elongation factor [Gemmatimonadales bacterium]|nr:selenocysteine-specific translation elongation factor [Gemmatimonadales bacterium]